MVSATASSEPLSFDGTQNVTSSKRKPIKTAIYPVVSAAAMNTHLQHSAGPWQYIANDKPVPNQKLHTITLKWNSQH